jgi:hypothetical protein
MSPVRAILGRRNATSVDDAVAYVRSEMAGNGIADLTP